MTTPSSFWRTPRHALRALALLWLLLLAGWLLSTEVHAQTSNPKIAQDLRRVLDAPSTPALNWARDVNGVRHVKLLIVSNSDDAELSALRKAVMAADGSTS